MNCKNCGSPLGPNEVFCRMCGASVDMQQQPQVQNQPQEISQPPVTVASTPQQGVGTQVHQNPGGVPPITPVVPPTIAPTMPTNGMVQANPGVPNPMGNNMMAPNTMGQQSAIAQNHSNKSSKMLIVIIVVVAIAIVGIVLYFTVFKDSGSSSGNNSSNNPSSSNSPSNSNSNSGSNSSSNPNVSVNTFTINHGGFTFQIPIQYETAVDDEYLVVTDGSSWQMGIIPILGTYESISEEELRNLATQDGATDIEIDKKNINGREYIVMTFSYSGYKEVVAYTKANSYYVFGIEIINAANTYGTDLLETADQILSAAVYSGTGNSFGMANSQLDFKKYITK